MRTARKTIEVLVMTLAAACTGACVAPRADDAPPVDAPFVDAPFVEAPARAAEALSESAIARVVALDPLATSPRETVERPQRLSNGAVEVEVWTERGGAVNLRLSHAEAYGETGRALAIGELRIACDPPLPTTRFMQRHRRADGVVEIEFGPDAGSEAFAGIAPADEACVSIAVDPESPHVAVSMRSRLARACEIRLERLRDADRVVETTEIPAWARAVEDGDRSARIESADTVVPLDAEPDAVLWYHRNERSIMHETLVARGLGAVATEFEDPFLMRTFGARVDAHGCARVDERTLRSGAALVELHAVVTVACVQADDMGGWLRRLRTSAGLAPRADEIRARATQWWRERWARGWLLFEPRSAEAGDPAQATREVEARNAPIVAQRVAALARGRGAWPSGSRADATVVHWTEWCAAVRTALALGDIDRVENAVESLARIVPALRAATRATHGSRGVLVPATTTIFGLDAVRRADMADTADGADRADRLAQARTTLEIAELLAVPCVQALRSGLWNRATTPFLTEAAEALADLPPENLDDACRARVARVAQALRVAPATFATTEVRARWRVAAGRHRSRDDAPTQHRSDVDAARFDGALGPVLPLLVAVETETETGAGTETETGAETAAGSVDRVVWLLPAWPRAWNASFRVHAWGSDRGATELAGRVRDGRIEHLSIGGVEASDPAFAAAIRSIRLGAGWRVSPGSPDGRGP